jgi:hypothetical protein
MANAFKCDSCGEYSDGEPAIITIHPNNFHEKILKYDLCPFCFNEVVEVVTKEKAYGDLD